MDKTYKIFYKKYPRSRKLHEHIIKAETQSQAELIFNLTKKLCKLVDFNRCRHMTLVAVFEMEG
jgi:hypothetical protein